MISGQSLEILVQGNGVSLDPGKAKGDGLENLKQRVGKLNGSCQINLLTVREQQSL